MKRKIITPTVTMLFLASMLIVAFNVAQVVGHEGDVLSAWASIPPTIDGVISTGEWDDADTASFTWSYTVPAWDIDETHLVELCVMNDADNLYMAVVIHGDDYLDYFYACPAGTCVIRDLLQVYFDNDHDATSTSERENGDDILRVWSNSYADDGYYDEVLSPYDGWVPKSDVVSDGTQEILGATSHTNPTNFELGDYTFELSHPLNTADDAHDFSLSTGCCVGFYVTFFDWVIDPVTGVIKGNVQSVFPTTGIFANIKVARLDPYPETTISPPSVEVTLFPGQSHTEFKTVDAGGPFCHLTFQAPGYGGWVTFSPSEFISVAAGSSLSVDVTITPPVGTPSGDYTFTVQAIGDGEIVATQSVTVYVPYPSFSPELVDMTLNPGEPGTERKYITAGATTIDISLEVFESIYVGWVTFDPPSRADVSPGTTVWIDETVTPPEGTSPGDYEFHVQVFGDGVLIGTQTVTIHVVPTVDYIDGLIREFVGEIDEAFDRGDIPRGTRNSLIAKLGAVVVSKEKGNYGAAVNKMDAFINELCAQYGAGRVSDSDPYCYYTTWRNKAENTKTLLEDLAGQ